MNEYFMSCSHREHATYGFCSIEELIIQLKSCFIRPSTVVL
jgi:hypothetical protein